MKPLCMIPFTRAYVYVNGLFRTCCNTQEIMAGEDDQSFQDWWRGSIMQDFRQQLASDQLPQACEKCALSERMHGSSLRMSANQQNADADLVMQSCQDSPNSWHVMFGNTCNLACWTCSENASSVIATHKTKLRMIPADFEDPNQRFLAAWPKIKHGILQSYQHHDTVSISVLGGEPTYNPVVLDFLQELVQDGVSKRTRIEITTNGTKLNDRIGALLHKNNWQYLNLFVSVDAVGDLAEAVRYGSDWSRVDHNIGHYATTVDNLEIHTMVSILNLQGLPQLRHYCQSKNLSQHLHTVSYPWWFDIRNWDGGRDWIDQSAFDHADLSGYLDLLGSHARPGTQQAAKAYVDGLAQIRTEFQRPDHAFAHLLPH